VYVSGDLLIYYEEGNPKKVVVPDAFVVKDCDPGSRRVYKLWEEESPPDVVFETTSRSTRDNDLIVKPETYQRIGVKEYFLYDPTGDYLKPALQGFRLEPQGYAHIEADAAGALESRELDLLLQLVDGDLVMIDAQTGERLQTHAEAEEAAEARANAAEKELRRLRRQLGVDETSRE
jgi:Uma2 family endonuclease